MTATTTDKLPIVCLLCGGKSSRAGGVDKATLTLGRRRMIDIIIERLAPQTRQIIISGPDNYDTGLLALPDRADGPRGPAAGLWAFISWSQVHAPNETGFLTAPVDGPFLPLDLGECLASKDSCAIACDENTNHPTFAYWDIARLKKVLSDDANTKKAALHYIAKKCDAERVTFHSPALMNVNTMLDLAKAEQLLAQNKH